MLILFKLLLRMDGLHIVTVALCSAACFFNLLWGVVRKIECWRCNLYKRKRGFVGGDGSTIYLKSELFSLAALLC